MLLPRFSSPLLALFCLLFPASLSFAADRDKPFVAVPFTQENTFTAGIEGPA